MDQPIDTVAFRRRLEARREELDRMSRESAASRSPIELDQARVGRLSRMDALQVQAMALAAERRRRDEIRRIESALERIAGGDFGYCAACDEPIAPKRLEADPTVPTCIACAAGSGEGAVSRGPQIR